MGDRIGSGRIPSGRINAHPGGFQRHRSVPRTNLAAGNQFAQNVLPYQMQNGGEPWQAQGAQRYEQGQGGNQFNPDPNMMGNYENGNWRNQAGPSGVYQAPHQRNMQQRADAARGRAPNQRYQRPRANSDSVNQYNEQQRRPAGDRQFKRKFHVGFKKLEEWSKEEPDTIITALVSQKVGFEELLESELSYDTLVLVLTILAKMCSSAFNANKSEIMNLVSQEKFISQLKMFIIQLPLQDRQERGRNRYFWKDIDGFFNNLCIVCESIIETIPTRACEVLPKLVKAVNLNMGNFETQQQQQVCLEVKQKMEKLQTKLELHKTEMEKKKKEVHYNFHEEEPPDDFRQLTVYPTCEEILTVEQAFVRRHIIKGAYNDVDHYLDVQFRLLKEDFVAPLREGIFAYSNPDPNKKRKISNVRIHPHVEFLCPKFGRDQVGVLVQFEFETNKNKRRMNYNYSRRFMYGSLVCFTRDNFQTVLFGKIIERDPKMLELRQVVVGFEAGYDHYELNQPYVMVECSVYFEPYYHVLKALQNMEEDGFPMKNYIIDVKTDVEPPNYLTQGSIFAIKNFQVPLFAYGAWPSAQELGFDDTQHNAFKAALTEKFVVIQGPPGTGKTYLGLQIAKTLIENKRYWYTGRSTPILVVCFTNHALDQFLEGLIDTTKDIVRVGGQSKNKNLEQFNLRQKRLNTSSRGVDGALYVLRKDLAQQLSQIKNWSEGLDEIHRFQSVVKFRHFSSVDREFADSWFAKASETAIMEWLFGGRTRQQQQQEILRARVEEMQKEEEEDHHDTDEELDGLLDAQNRAEHDIDDDSDLLEAFTSTSEKPTFLTSFSQMDQTIKNLTMNINRLASQVNEDAVFDKTWELERKRYELQDDLEYLQMRLNQGRQIRVTEKPLDANLKQPQNMAPDDRWRLYFYWLGLYRASLIKQLTDVQAVYRTKHKQYVEIKDIDDTQVMRQMLVVGMTTTGAARLQTTLQALKCRIVIVEEAAEVLESHIIVSLTNYCEHLILIGDHQQLRPSTADFRMETDFNLGISLFERMVQNKVQCRVLGVQHRMRPEIAKLIVPAIYPVLENHPSVLQFPPVMGIDPCMYFINHDHREEEAGDSSKLNLHEAEFLINLARYLIQNGYQPEDITILAAYSGQMFALWRQRKKFDVLLEDVRITVLDNYQGEESKIILLSLVRNNEDDAIGFLKTENRVCVALSRAKEGFYMMGNMDLLCRKSQIWPKIKASLESQNFLGETLALRCQIHPEEVTRVKSAKDFRHVPEGGCKKVCGAQMDCGHQCARICHILDRTHDTTKCKAACNKILCTNNHLCPKMCYEECCLCQVPVKTTLACGHEHAIACYIDPKDYKCPTPVRAELPCGHTVKNKECHQNIETFRCPFPCDTRVEPCGHSCSWQCHIKRDPDHLHYKCFKPCAKPRKGCSTGKHSCPNPCHQDCAPCTMVMLKTRTVCPHRFNVQCNVDVDKVECHKPCAKDLPCGHQCKRKCYEPCGNCQVMVKKTLPECNHVVKAKCSEEPNRKNCRGKCPLLLSSCGHVCQERCNQPCTTKCKELTDHSKPADCRHKFKIECCLRDTELPSNSYKLLKFCKEPCIAILECNHRCSGTCGRCAQGRVHESCKENCGVPLICGHECPIPCRETCQPCTQKCSYQCKHSICKKKCGEPCTKCQERCGRRCPHGQCDAKCGEKCTVPPCMEPCNALLPCGHPCVGYCGEPCPPLCRICNHEELTEVFLGFEDEVDARFVLLDECKHVLESQGMDGWLQQGGNEINQKTCPKCKTPLSSTQRYSDYIKQAIQDVIAIKKKFFGNFKENEVKRAKLLQRLEELQKNCVQLRLHAPVLPRLFSDLEQSLAPVRRDKRQPLNMLLAKTCTSKIQILENIVDIFTGAKLKDKNAIKKAAGYANFLFRFLMRHEEIKTNQGTIEAQRITNQEITDLQKELQRFTRIVQLCQICDCKKFLTIIPNKPNVKALYEQINELAFSVLVYTDRLHASLKDKLVKLSAEIEAGIAITDKERQEIVRAMGMGKGHWYKCPNGHIYAITECGGAVQVSTCNECGEQIGGTDHALLPSNQHTGEMDGSRFAAYSETANNLFNFEEFRNQLD